MAPFPLCLLLPRAERHECKEALRAEARAQQAGAASCAARALL
jgi:hypothetical protein